MKMKKFLALVLALGSAVYLNWQFDGNRSLTAANALENEKNYGETQFVSTESSALEQVGNEPPKPADGQEKAQEKENEDGKAD